MRQAGSKAITLSCAYKWVQFLCEAVGFQACGPNIHAQSDIHDQNIIQTCNILKVNTIRRCLDMMTESRNNVINVTNFNKYEYFGYSEHFSGKVMTKPA